MNGNGAGTKTRRSTCLLAVMPASWSPLVSSLTWSRSRGWHTRSLRWRERTGVVVEFAARRSHLVSPALAARWCRIGDGGRSL